jgi:hypothetical protein
MFTKIHKNFHQMLHLIIMTAQTKMFHALHWNFYGFCVTQSGAKGCFLPSTRLCNLLHKRRKDIKWFPSNQSRRRMAMMKVATTCLFMSLRVKCAHLIATHLFNFRKVKHLNELSSFGLTFHFFSSRYLLRMVMNVRLALKFMREWAIRKSCVKVSWKFNHKQNNNNSINFPFPSTNFFCKL